MTFRVPPLQPGDLFETARKLAAEVEPPLALLTGPARAAAVRAVWTRAATLGWPGVMVPEVLGGAGGSVGDLAAIVEGAGRSGFPLPIALAGVASTLLAGIEGSDALLEGMAEGRMRLCPVIDDPLPILTGGAGGAPIAQGHRVAESLPDVTHLLVAGRTEDGQCVLLLLPREAPGVTAVELERLDGSPCIKLSFDRAAVADDAVLARGGAVDRQVRDALHLGALMACVETEAALATVLEDLIAHLAAREQFGVKLASFQTLRHRTADIFVQTRCLRALVVRGVRNWRSGDPDAWRQASQAKFYLGQIARGIAKDAIQMHGGIGLTQELLAARLCKRILVSDFRYGDATRHAGYLLGEAPAPSA